MKKYVTMLDRAVYPKEALLKTAYTFIKKYYIHIEQDEKYFKVTITAKGENDLPEMISPEFENELLAQTVRHQVYFQTHTIREILMARAMASTMVMEKDPTDMILEETGFTSKDDLDSILEDWFHHEA